MIVRCQDGGLLETDHVVRWGKQPHPHSKPGTEVVVAKTVLDTDVQVYEGTPEACDQYLEDINARRDEERTVLRHLCEGLVKRNDALAAAINRLIATLNQGGTVWRSH